MENSMTGDPQKPQSGELGRFVKLRSDADNTADVRDFIALAIAKRATDVKDKELHAGFMQIVDKIGADKARKLVDRISIFNQTQKEGGPEDRIAAFYETEVTNPTIKPLIEKIKTFGSGVRAGYKDSSEAGIQALQRIEGQGVDLRIEGQGADLSQPMKMISRVQ